MRKTALLLTMAFLLAGCGGGGGSSESTPPTLSFYAFDFVEGQVYEVAATKVSEGDHCYVYLERGMEVDQAAILSLVSQFDHAIYPGLRDAFGSEPNPGVDNDPKIYILLMDIRDGFTGTSYIAGYFDPYNEYPKSVAPGSNEKEIFYMDVDPGIPSGAGFRRTLAHEFQHMIHWNLKYNDDIWLNEAMSEIAPFFAGYGPNYSRVLIYESEDNRSDSLTTWDGELADYAVTYMWAQYMADRFSDDDIFRTILSYDNTGMDSVERYLKSRDSSLSASSVFRDWSIAVFSGSNDALTDNASWYYRTIDTWAGVHYDSFGAEFDLPGMFTWSNLNQPELPILTPWSIDMYWFDVPSPLTWTAASSPAPLASAYDWHGWDVPGALTYDLPSGTAFPYDNSAILILQNPSLDNASDSEVSAAPGSAVSPAARVEAMSQSGAVKTLVKATGEPVPVCVHDFFMRRDREHRKRMKEAGHGR